MNKLRAVTVAVSLLVLFLAGAGSAEPRENYRSFYYRPEARSMPIQQIQSSGETCMECHERVTPRVTAEHKSGVHFKVGVSCESCHGTDHSAMMVVTGKKVCSKCHQTETKEMLSSKHANSWQNSWRSARFEVLPKSMRQQGCARCHDISYGMYEVKDVRCDYCHTSHQFSLEQARNPLSCYTCHMGPDHPQAEAYSASKHGQVFSGTQGKDNTDVPTCITCHQSNKSHNVSQNISIGGAANGGILDSWGWFKDSEGKPLMKRTVLTAAQFQKAREEADRVCSKCHERGFGMESLGKADVVKELTERQLAASRALVIELDSAGLLYPDPGTRPANPVEGNKLVLGGNQLYTDISKAEAIYFKLFKFAGSGGWKSAYHQEFSGADINTENLKSLAGELKDEAEVLRLLGTDAPVIALKSPEPDSKNKIKLILAGITGLLFGGLLAFVLPTFKKNGRGFFKGTFLVILIIGGLAVMPGSASAWDKGQHKQCASCHRMQAESLRSGKHSGLQCLDCHVSGAGVSQVKQPAACGKCHSGANGYQLETYLSSPHGVKYRINGLGQWAPTCATCHMSRGDHNPMVRQPGEAWPDSKIGKVCLSCHITDEMQKFGSDIDDIYKSADSATAGLRQAGLDLIEKGVLIPQNGNRRDIEGVKARWGIETSWELVNQDQLSQREQEMTQKLVAQLVAKTLEGTREASVKMKIGAAHVNPDYTHWYGNAYLNLNLAEVRGTARELEMFAYKTGFRGRQNQSSLMQFLLVGLLTAVVGFYISAGFLRKGRE
ncbi:MAG TPA: multiheme c-type cytochrome [Desulfobacteria bacterium]|nr:multiheme c-type cytochrome [Desulfobacteria bacterium]